MVSPQHNDVGLDLTPSVADVVANISCNVIISLIPDIHCSSMYVSHHSGSAECALRQKSALSTNAYGCVLNLTLNPLAESTF